MRVWYEDIRLPNNTIVNVASTPNADNTNVTEDHLLYKPYYTRTCGPSLVLPPFASCTIVAQCPLPVSLTSKIMRETTNLFVAQLAVCNQT